MKFVLVKKIVLTEMLPVESLFNKKGQIYTFRLLPFRFG